MLSQNRNGKIHTVCLQGEEDWGSGEFVQYFRGEILLSPKVTSFGQGGSAHWLSFQLSGLFQVFSALEPLFTEIKCHQMFRKITTVKILYLQEGKRNFYMPKCSHGWEVELVWDKATAPEVPEFR